MSRKTLIALIVLLAVLAGAAWLQNRRTAGPEIAAAAPGGALLPAVDLSTVRAIAIAEAVATTHLARVEGNWCVTEMENYPADLDRLRELIRSLDGAEAGQIAEKGPEHLAEFGLAADGELKPIRISLEHAQGTTVLSLGRMREPQAGAAYWGPALGRYARVDEGPVQLLKEDIRGVQTDSDQWWDRKLLEVPPEALRQVDADVGGEAFAVTRDTNGTYTLMGAVEGENLDAGAASRLFGALRNLRAQKILTEAEGGGSNFAATDLFKAAADGATYAIQVGAARPDEGGGRAVKIDVTAAESATPEQRTAVAAAVKKFTGRVFLLPAYLVEPLVLQKDALLGKASPAPETPAQPEPEVALPALENPEESQPAAESTPAEAPPVPVETPAKPPAES